MTSQKPLRNRNLPSRFQVQKRLFEFAAKAKDGKPAGYLHAYINCSGEIVVRLLSPETGKVMAVPLEPDTAHEMAFQISDHICRENGWRDG